MKGAYEYAQSLTSSANILLMNGRQLAEYIYEYGLGMQSGRVIELKKIDSDFWDALEDDAWSIYQNFLTGQSPSCTDRQMIWFVRKKLQRLAP